MIGGVDDVPDRLLVQRRKAGLSPTAHLPSDEDPLEPRCEHASERGYRPITSADVDEDQLCGWCFGYDNRGVGTPDRYSQVLENMSVEEFDRRVRS